MKKLQEKSLEELFAILFDIDEDLQNKKNERQKLIVTKSQELEEKHGDSEEDYATKSRLLDEYKEDLNEILGIDLLRRQRETVREAISERESKTDSAPAENYI